MDDGHLVGAVGKDRGLDKSAIPQCPFSDPFAADAQPGAFGLAALDVAQYLLQVGGADQRPHVGSLVQRIADDHGFGALADPFDKGVVNVVVNEHAGGVGADLPLGVEVAHHGRGDGVRQIRVREHDERGFAPQLHSHLFEGGRRAGHHPFSGGHRARE